jgi:hypothetical protein
MTAAAPSGVITFLFTDIGVIHSTSGRLTPLRKVSNAFGRGSFGSIFVCDRQYCAARQAVTPLVARR